MTVSDRPSAAEGLEVTAVEDGLVVYDPERDRVHYLNATAAVVFTFCDGARDRQSVVEGVTRVLGPDAVSHHDVEACIAQLEGERVLRSGE